MSEDDKIVAFLLWALRAQGYEWVPNGKRLVFPDGTVEEGYVLRKMN